MGPVETQRLRINRIAGPLMGLMLLWLSGPSSGQNYPERPIVLTVAYAPGGATDLQARVVSLPARNEAYFGQPMIISNKPGAGGKVGWTWFMTRARKTGYDVAAYNLPHVIAQSIVFDAAYSVNNLEPIANWGADPAVLIVARNSPFESVADLLAYARNNPRRITASGAGLYVGHPIALLQFERATDTELTYVPHTGGTPALTAVIAGQVQAGFNNLSDAYRSRDQLKILAVADLERNQEFLPDVPTFLEQGVDVDDSSVNFRGFMVPEGTPPEVINILAERAPSMFRDSEVLRRMREGGAPMRIMEREEVRSMWQRRQAVLQDLLTDLRE